MTLCLTGAKTWNPEWARLVPFPLDAPVLSEASRGEVLRAALGETPDVTDADVATLARLRMRPLQIVHLVEAARREARAQSRAVSPADLETASRQLNSVSLDALATRITPEATWDDLVLPARDRPVGPRRRVRGRVTQEHVQDDWGFGIGTRRLGIVALFAGPPGTGKTMAAEVIAGELGLDLYVDRPGHAWWTSTSARPRRTSSGSSPRPSDVNGVLFFDEADALFGKRSEVSDAHDRYANVEVAYLLQRLERVRRRRRAGHQPAGQPRRGLHPPPRRDRVDFPLPDGGRAPRHLGQRAAGRRAAGRRRRPGLPRARASSCPAAASATSPSAPPTSPPRTAPTVAMRHLIRSAALEYRKLGRLVVESEFRQYFGDTQDEAVAP